MAARRGVVSTAEIQQYVAAALRISTSAVRYDAAAFINTHRIPTPPDTPHGWGVIAITDFLLDYESISPRPTWPAQVKQNAERPA